MPASVFDESRGYMYGSSQTPTIKGKRARGMHPKSAQQSAKSAYFLSFLTWEGDCTVLHGPLHLGQRFASLANSVPTKMGYHS